MRLTVYVPCGGCDRLIDVTDRGWSVPRPLCARCEKNVRESLRVVRGRRKERG